MEITYTQIGDYLYPNITLGEDDKLPIGKYGRISPVSSSSLSSFLHRQCFAETRSRISQICVQEGLGDASPTSRLHPW